MPLQSISKWKGSVTGVTRERLDSFVNSSNLATIKKKITAIRIKEWLTEKMCTGKTQLKVWRKLTCLHKFGGEEKVDWQWRHFHLVGVEWVRFWWACNAFPEANTFAHPWFGHLDIVISLWMADVFEGMCGSVSSLFSKFDIFTLLKFDILHSRWSEYYLTDSRKSDTNSCWRKRRIASEAFKQFIWEWNENSNS